MKTPEQVTQAFEQSFDNHYVIAWLDALRTNERQHRYWYLNEDNILFTNTKQPENYSAALHLYFEPKDFFTEKLDLNRLIKYLTDEEKTKYIQKQNMLLENDDYIYYNINELMIKWVKDNAFHAIEDYLKSIINARKEKFKTYQVYFNAIKALENKAKENMNVKTKIVKRDIVSELIAEHKELTDKLEKLKTFIISSDTFKLLSKDEQLAMNSQSNAMSKYAKALEKRIQLISAREGR